MHLTFYGIKRLTKDSEHSKNFQQVILRLSLHQLLHFIPVKPEEIIYWWGLVTQYCE